ncbi:MAG TPA: hypothetical protein VJH97_06410 [Candidatus Nanoarchaeia archaeon]|nr:hypothetical protein [Candidatus Nanoarchaeia archaeon]
MAKKKDPWAKDNLGKTLEERVSQHDNIINVVDAMDGELKAKIAGLLPKSGDGNVPNYDVLDRTKKVYDKKIAEQVAELIESHYDFSNKLHPLNKAMSKAKVDDTTRQLVKGIYGGHVEALKQHVGDPNYIALVSELQQNNRENISNQIARSAAAGYSHEKHGKHLADYMLKQHNADAKYVNLDQLARAGPDVIAQHIRHRLHKEGLYQIAPKYEKAP